MQIFSCSGCWSPSSLLLPAHYELLHTWVCLSTTSVLFDYKAVSGFQTPRYFTMYFIWLHACHTKEGPRQSHTTNKIQPGARSSRTTREVNPRASAQLRWGLGPGRASARRCCLLQLSWGGSLFCSDTSQEEPSAAVAFLVWSDVKRSASRESGSLRQKSSFSWNLISLGPSQASSHSAGYQFWVSSASVHFSHI